LFLLSQTSESRKKNKKDVLKNGNFKGSPARKEQLSQRACTAVTWLQTGMKHGQLVDVLNALA
jgi:hypothetical protein